MRGGGYRWAWYKGEAMTEQSHREEMNAAIRAQRERQAVPRTVAPAEEQEPPPPAPEPERKTLLARLLGK
jgi:hypothetical protein